MEYDVWFTRYDGNLFVAFASPGEPPNHRPKLVSSVKVVYDKLRKNGHSVAQVGILDAEMLGLE